MYGISSNQKHLRLEAEKFNDFLINEFDLYKKGQFVHVEKQRLILRKGFSAGALFRNIPHHPNTSPRNAQIDSRTHMTQHRAR